MIAWMNNSQNRHRAGILRSGNGFGSPSGFASGFIPNFAAQNPNSGSSQTSSGTLTSSIEEALSDRYVDPPIKPRHDAMDSFFNQKIPNFAIYDPSRTPGNAPRAIKGALLSMQSLSAMVSQNLGLGFDEIGTPTSVNVANRSQFQKMGAGWAGAAVSGTDVYFSTDQKNKGWLLSAIANESVHVNQSARNYEIPGSHKEHAQKLKKFANFLQSQGMMSSQTASGYDDPRLVRYSYNDAMGSRSSESIRKEATAMQEEGFKEAREQYGKQANETTNTLSKNAQEQYKAAQIRAQETMHSFRQQIVEFHQQMKKQISGINKKAMSWAASSFRSDVPIGSELRHSDNSKQYLIERFSSLMSGLVQGIQFGSILPEEMVPPNVAKDLEQAERMVQMVFGAERSLAASGIESASGFIPNFANVSAESEMKEKIMAKMHGYNAGRVMKKRLHDGTGKSFLGTVNSAENIDNFINSDGKKATMVTPPNGFAGGYEPKMFNPDSINKGIETFNSNASLMTRKVQEVNSALSNLANQNNPQPAPMPAQSGPINADVVFANPMITPSYSFQINGLESMASQLNAINMQVVQQYQAQAVKIDYINQALQDLRHALNKGSV
jgi:hypothetical protein